MEEADEVKEAFLVELILQFSEFGVAWLSYSVLVRGFLLYLAVFE
jgi:hypothetical protein